MSTPIQALKAAHNLTLVWTQLQAWEPIEVLVRRLLFDNDTQLLQHGQSADQMYLISEASRLKDFGVLALIRLNRLEDAWQAMVRGQGRLQRLWRGDADEPQDVGEEIAIPQPGEMTVAFLVPPRGFGIEVLIRRLGADQQAIIDHLAIPEFGMSQIETLLYREEDGVLGWMRGYLASKKAEKRADFEATIDRMLSVVGEGLMPLWDYLERFPAPEKLHYVTNSGLALFPVHVAMPEPLQAGDWARTRIEYLSSMGGKAGHESEAVGYSDLLCIGDPRDDLPHGREEAEILSNMYESSTTLMSNTATRGQVIGALQKKQQPNVVHFSCHGRYVWGDPERSGLELAEGQRLSMEDIQHQCRFAKDSIVLLSACETGVTDFRRLPSEGFGLPLAFHIAGARYVIASLWPVSDQLTKYLMLKFHLLMREGISPAFALKQAQAWLKDATWKELSNLTELNNGEDQARSLRWTADVVAQAVNAEEVPFAHPVYWAGFVSSAFL